MPDYTVEIEELEALLNSAETQTTVDGTSSRVDLKEARRRLEYLKRNHVGPEGERRMVRPTIIQARLG